MSTVHSTDVSRPTTPLAHRASETGRASNGSKTASGSSSPVVASYRHDPYSPVVSGYSCTPPPPSSLESPPPLPLSFTPSGQSNHGNHAGMSLEDLDTALLEGMSFQTGSGQNNHYHSGGSNSGSAYNHPAIRSGYPSPAIVTPPPAGETFPSGPSECTDCAECTSLARTQSEEPQSALNCPPEGTLHTSLWDRVTFIPYPQDEFVPPQDAVPALGGGRKEGEIDVTDNAVEKETSTGKPTDLVRCFLGQLPYGVTEMQLNWLCYTFGDKHTVCHAERIVKKQAAHGERMPTGCVHAYCTRSAVERMAALMHKKLLVDDTGVWVGQTPAEAETLKAYVDGMKADRRLRMPSRPYDTVVVQLATSTFIPRRVSQAAELLQASSTVGGAAADVGPRFGSRQEAEAHCVKEAFNRGTPPPQPLMGMNSRSSGGHTRAAYYGPQPPSQSQTTAFGNTFTNNVEHNQFNGYQSSELYGRQQGGYHGAPSGRRRVAQTQQQYQGGSVEAFSAYPGGNYHAKGCSTANAPTMMQELRQSQQYSAYRSQPQCHSEGYYQESYGSQQAYQLVPVMSTPEHGIYQTEARTVAPPQNLPW